MDKPGAQRVELWGGPCDGQIDIVQRGVHELRVLLPIPGFGPEGPPPPTDPTPLPIARYQRTSRRSWRFRYAGME